VNGPEHYQLAETWAQQAANRIEAEDAAVAAQIAAAHAQLAAAAAVVHAAQAITRASGGNPLPLAGAWTEVMR
jgi:hypothetical protein